MSGSTTLRSAWLVGVAAVGLAFGILSHGLGVGATTESNLATHPGTTKTTPEMGSIDAGSPTSVSFTASDRVGGPRDRATAADRAAPSSS